MGSNPIMPKKIRDHPSDGSGRGVMGRHHSSECSPSGGTARSGSYPEEMRRADGRGEEMPVHDCSHRGKL